MPELILDVSKPLWDLTTFSGRFKYYAWMTDYRTCLLSTEKLMQAKLLVEKYKSGETTGISNDEIKYAMKLYSSAFHPDSGELQNFAGRMSFQVPGGMLLTGAMLTFYQSTPAVLFWQFANQSFNALVNYTNRNAKSATTVTQLGVSYISATAAALITAIGSKKYWTKTASPMMQRFVPFAAVASANCVNIPLMRQSEIIDGIDVQDENENIIGKSRVAPVKGITQVIIARIAMCAPGMVLMPFIMERLEKNATFKRLTWTHAPFQTLLVGGFLTLMVPTACAIFPQKCSVKTSTIQRFEPEFYKEMVEKTKGKVPERVYFNKGL